MRSILSLGRKTIRSATRALFGSSVRCSFDTMNAGGDEGTVAGRFEADQGTSEFSATVSSVSSNTINYSSAVNENIRGEQRFLVDTGVSN